MEAVLNFPGDNDMSYEDADSPPASPFSMTLPEHTGSYDLEQKRQEQQEGQPPESYIINTHPDAAWNTNTNATTRGDSQSYVELNELVGEKWQETGRWVGYEETFNPTTGKWGSSHISCLTFRSLIQLRRVMSTAAVLLDLSEKDFIVIAEKIVDELLGKNEIRASDQGTLLKALLEKRSQAGGTQVTSAGIEMQTFSVTKQRDTSDNVEASIVLSGAVDSLQKPVVAFVRLQDSVVMDGIMEASVPVRFIFVLAGPAESGIDFHESGRAMGTLLADWVFSLEAYLADSEKELNNAIADFMDCSIVIPPTEIQTETMLQPIIRFQKKMLRERLRPADTRILLGAKAKEPEQPRDDPLARTGYPFGGMVKDIKRRYRHYLSDFIDAINPQVLSAIIFIYFAALSPAITFGGLLADKTNKWMGVPELMISTSIQGIIFCLFAAQPVLVIGFSGPLLVFEEAFYNFCNSQGYEYIVGRVWVGMWLIIIVLIVVAAEASFLVRFISRFTQEIFSILISLIFIYETFFKLYKIFKDYPLKNTSVANSTNGSTAQDHYPNTALLSMCLMLGCFFIAYFFRRFKNSIFLPGPIRRMIGDFGVPIALLLMVVVDVSIKDVYTQKLQVPKGLNVSKPEERGWIINPMGLKETFPTWLIFACAIPALLVFILIFLESQITTLIVSKPERKMVKGSGFHLDLLLIVMMGGIASIFGFPWLSATTVRSVTHANALTVMSKGPKPEITKVLEQRVSGIIVATLVGASIFMEPVLTLIPMSALFGIFLYMGVTSLSGVQLWDRIQLLIVPKKYHPSLPYATRVKTWRMHLFTLIQLVCLGILWAVKSTEASLALPFVLILTVPLRIFMSGRLFTTTEMKCLDSDDAKVTFEEEQGVDVYDECPFS
ncbi:solute carrier family 4 member 1a (Diego blood group) [Pangasianodon hypophthalmus]|uniref:solute carrier family 4 member 1a (Diego blood group) n=1 Tax=Pangasianodon hypophthalmus TaxID=310915 RepID=UPI002306F830|nr:solute carrier family 4 member 1a (Diego blood group) [Pangasianodon hypophthalmus]